MPNIYCVYYTFTHTCIHMCLSELLLTTHVSHLKKRLHYQPFKILGSFYFGIIMQLLRYLVWEIVHTICGMQLQPAAQKGPMALHPVGSSGNILQKLCLSVTTRYWHWQLWRYRTALSPQGAAFWDWLFPLTSFSEESCRLLPVSVVCSFLCLQVMDVPQLI